MEKKKKKKKKKKPAKAIHNFKLRNSVFITDNYLERWKGIVVLTSDQIMIARQ